MIETVYHEWEHPSGELRQLHMPVAVTRLNRTVTNYQGVTLVGFWMPNNYATDAGRYQAYLREECLAALTAAQEDVVFEDGSLLLTEAWRSWGAQMEAYRRKPDLAVHPDKSNHPRGTAIDVTPHGISQDRMEEILHAHGWVRTVPHEPWHFDFAG